MEILISKSNAFDQISVKTLLRLITTTLVASVLISYIIMYKLTYKKPFIKIVLILLTIIIFRFGVTYLGGNASPHPPLSGFPPLIFSVIFGMNDLSFRLSYFVPYTLFAYFVHLSFSCLNNEICPG